MSNHYEVLLKRGSYIESKHNVHAVICDKKGRILMHAGNHGYETFIRSSLKPFQSLPLVSSGTTAKYKIAERGIAIASGSHAGTTKHAREAFKILWNSEVDIDYLKCPIPSGAKSKLEHNCSGKHAGFLATCKRMGWPLETYLEKTHPLQIEIIRRVTDLINLPKDEMVFAKDDCGAPTLYMRLSQMAYLYALLGSSQNPEFEQINRSMLSYPELVSGEGRFDTELMRHAHGQLISKGGSEGIQCISRLREGIGVAIKVEDGSKRAKHATAIAILKELDWVTPSGLEILQQNLSSTLRKGLEVEVKGNLKFQES